MLPWMLVFLASGISMSLTNALSLQARLISLAEPLDLGISQVRMSHYRDKPVEGKKYDFIVVGGGPAGCVIANRLSENPNWTVYLIESGGVEGLSHRIPLMAPFLPNTPTNWGYLSTPQKNACKGMNDDTCALPRGKILGGTSSMNFMIYIRGNKYDYDKWAAAGAKGWSYDEVMPYFLKSERAVLSGLENSPYHNHTGPLSVEDVKFRTKITSAYLEAAEQAGHASIDYNGETQIGTSWVQANTLNGRRHSSFRSFIEPIRNQRKNLHIITEAHVTRVLIDQDTKAAKGVEVLYRNKKFKIYANKEVILSAGAFHSPQILMLSGVGPADNLKEVGVPLVKELPVGAKLYDHLCHFGPTFLTNTTGETIYIANVGVGTATKYALGRTNTVLSSIGAVEALTIFKLNNTDGPASYPDIELITVAGGLASDEGQGLIPGANFKQEIYDKVYAPLAKTKQDHFSFLVLHYHPKSVGSITLNSNDPLDKVRIDPNFLSNPFDVEAQLAGIREAIRIANSPALQKIGAKLLETPVPGCEQYTFNSDDYWRCSIRTLSYTLHHQVATCRMGAESDPTAVVNEELKVIGIDNLRVADTSIIPFTPCAHTNSMSFMIGEKGADMIRARWAGQ